MKLPHHSECVVSRRKIVDYLLSDKHPVGGPRRGSSDSWAIHLKAGIDLQQIYGLLLKGMKLPRKKSLHLGRDT